MENSKSTQKSEVQLLRIEAAAEIAGIGRSTAYSLIGSGEWHVVRIGKSVRVPRASLMAWIESEIERQNPGHEIHRNGK